jgi:AAA ATPase domain
MNQDDVVPKIDLAPKLKRPLSLWNPLDYLRLLYWVFYFPQALRWYEKAFGNNIEYSNTESFLQRWERIRKNPILKNLILQHLIALLGVNFSSTIFLGFLGFKMSWANVALGTSIGGFIFGVALNLINLSMASSSALSLVIGISLGAPLGIVPIIPLSISLGAVLCLVLGMSWCIQVLSASSGVAPSIVGNIIGLMLGLTVIYMISGVFWEYTISFVFRLPIRWDGTEKIYVVLATSILGACLLSILRAESWFLGTICCLSKNNYSHVSRISFIPIPSVSGKIVKELEKDWETGLYNANQVLAYSLQFIPVLQAVNFVLSEVSPEHLLRKTSLLAQQPFDWRMVKFASASWGDELKLSFINSLFILPKFIKRWLNRDLLLELRTDTPARSAAAGFWYLYNEKPEKALQAFLGLQSFPFGQEMCFLAQNLILCDQAVSDQNPVVIIADIPLLSIPPTPHLHPDSWPIVGGFQQVITDIKIVKTSNSRTNKSLALNRALGELDKILKQSKKIVTAEGDLIVKIAEAWQSALLTVTSEIGEIAILEPVISPYTIGDPVEGDAFVGRDNIMNQLSELWRQNKSVQSVVLYGHRRMGKTSILRNINDRLGDNVSLAYVNMLLMTSPQGEADILMFICDQIKIATGFDIPTNAEFIAFPETTCRRYIQAVIEKIGQRKLIIAIDEFEQIDELITSKKISPSFLSFLRGLVQLSPNIAFAFAGLHTLEERIANYSDPFFASFIPIRVGFLSLGATRQLLANPADQDFPLDYTPETLDRIYQLTAGQPFLTQLVGFQLVRHYNNQVFEAGHSRDPMLTIDDLNTVITDPVFFDRGRYYFTGVWNQASQDNPHQQTILLNLAPHLTGLSLAELSTTTNLNPTELTAALKILERHDVAACDQEKWRISIELFRRWVVDHLYALQ